MNHFPPSLQKRCSALLLVLCIFLFPCALASCGDSETPNGMKSDKITDEYAENIVDFQLFVPEDWTVRIASRTVAASAKDSTAGVSMAFFSLTGTPTLSSEWKKCKTEMEHSYSDLQIESEPDFSDTDACVTTVAGKDAIVCTYTASIGGNLCKYRQYLFIADGYLYVLTYSAAPEEFDGHTGELAQIVEALTFDKKKEAPDGMKAATHAEDRYVSSNSYSFFVEEDWVTETSTGVYTARFGGSLPTVFTVMTDSLEDPSRTPKEYFESFLEEFEKSFRSFELISGPKENLLSGSKGGRFSAAEYEYSVQVGEEGDVTAYRFCQVLCKNGEEMYILTFSTTENYYDDHIEYFMDILDNFTITE